jgi:hypothetical protein
MDARRSNPERRLGKAGRRVVGLAAERQRQGKAWVVEWSAVTRQGEVMVVVGTCALIECAGSGRGSSRADLDLQRRRR